jgi:hypothetical protein
MCHAVPTAADDEDFYRPFRSSTSYTPNRHRRVSVTGRTVTRRARRKFARRRFVRSDCAFGSTT